MTTPPIDALVKRAEALIVTWFTRVAPAVRHHVGQHDLNALRDAIVDDQVEQGEQGAPRPRVRPGALVRQRRRPDVAGIVRRWPSSCPDEPLDDGSDEWVVCWFYTDAVMEEAECAGDFDVVGYFPERT